MRRRLIENFDVISGDLAFNLTKKYNKKFIEVVKTDDEKARALFSYPDFKVWTSTIPASEMEYVTNKTKRNSVFLNGV